MLLGFCVELPVDFAVDDPPVVLAESVPDEEALVSVALLIVVLRLMTVPVPAAPLATAPVPARRGVVIETVALPAAVVVVTTVLLLPLLGTGIGIGAMGVMPEEADEVVDDELLEDELLEDDEEEEMTPVVAG